MADVASTKILTTLRHPTIIATHGYLDDAIRTNADHRFDPETALRQLNEIPVVDRDGARFAAVDIGASGSVYYPVKMFSPIYNRTNFSKTVVKEFTEIS